MQDAEDDEERCWFTADLDPVTKDYVAGGWYERLEQYAYTCVIQAIARKCDMRPPGGRDRTSVELSRSALRALLSLVPVMGLEGKPLSAPFHFPLEKQSLEEWVGQISPEDVVEPALELTDKMEDVLQEVSDGGKISRPNLAIIVKKESESQVQRSELSEQVEHIIEIEVKPEPKVVEVRDVQNYKVPTKMYAPEISPEDYAFISGTAKTKVAIAIAIAQQARNDYARVIGSMKQQMKAWEHEIAVLEKEAEELAFSEHVGLQVLEEARSLAERRDSLPRQSIENHGCMSFESRMPSVINTVDYRPSRTPAVSPMTTSSPCPDLAVSLQG